MAKKQAARRIKIVVAVSPDGDRAVFPRPSSATQAGMRTAVSLAGDNALIGQLLRGLFPDAPKRALHAHYQGWCYGHDMPLVRQRGGGMGNCAACNEAWGEKVRRDTRVWKEKVARGEIKRDDVIERLMARWESMEEEEESLGPEAGRGPAQGGLPEPGAERPPEGAP